MKALFLLIALYTITGKQAVVDGAVPDGSSCIYEQSGTKSGQMTAGNTIDMTFTGYGGATIHSVVLMMRSNTSAGAGSLLMQVGQQTAWQIADAAFNKQTWYGAYSADFVPIEKTFSGLTVSEGADISLHLEASANSLYLQSVQIDYSIPAAQPCTVRFDTHINQQVSPMTEASAGAGVILPEFQIYDADWQFYGWAERPMTDAETPAHTYPASSLYHPSGNCTMHAVYVHEGDAPQWYAADSVQTGAYVMTAYNPDLSDDCLMRATGAVSDGRILLQSGSAWLIEDEIVLPTTTYLPDEQYNITRSSDSTVTIQHAVSGKYVTLGKSSKFTTSSTATRHWSITPYTSADAPRGAFCLRQLMDGQTYYFGISYAVDTYTFYLKPTTDLANVRPMFFYSASDIHREPSVYTSYPYGNGVEQTAADRRNMTDYILDLGTYTIHIHNGKKTLQLK